jgi:hypothetical protein
MLPLELSYGVSLDLTCAKRLVHHNDYRALVSTDIISS